MTPDEIRNKKLREYPEYQTDPKMPAILGGRDVNAILEELQAFKEVPMDMSPLQKVLQARRTEGEADFLRGAMLAGKGGEEMAPLGKALAERGLEQGKAVRVNAADEAFQDPISGEIIANPFTQQKRLDAQRLGVVDKLLKERLAEAALANRQFDSQSRNVDRANNVTVKLINAGTAEHAVNAREAAAAAKRAAAGGTKPLQPTEIKDLKTLTTNYDNINRLNTEYKPEFAGDWTGRSGAELKTKIFSENPVLAKAILSRVPGGSKIAETQIARQQFWANQKYWDELPTRHELFGATLTEGESRAWRAAAIHEGMRDDEIKANLQKRHDILMEKVKESERIHLSNRRIPDAVLAATGRITGTKLPEPDDEAAPAPRASKPGRKRAADMTDDELLNPK